MEALAAALGAMVLAAIFTLGGAGLKKVSQILRARMGSGSREAEKPSANREKSDRQNALNANGPLQEKLEQCIRIALEYRGSAALRMVAEQQQMDSEERLTWRAAFPQQWATTRRGKLLQLLWLPLIAPLALVFIYTLVPLFQLFQRHRTRNRVRAAGYALSEAKIRRLAQQCTHGTLYEFWLAHGLPGRTSDINSESRRECLERWIDILYGRSMAVVLQIAERVYDVRTEHARATAQFCAAGGSVSLADSVDVVVRQLSQQLPPFRSIS